MTGPDERQQLTPPEDAPPSTSSKPIRAARTGLLTRRRLIVGSGIAALAVAGGTGTYASYQKSAPPPNQATTPPSPKSTQPSKAVEQRLRAGAMVGAPVDEKDVSRWKSDVDTLAENKQNLLRTGIYAWKVAPEENRWDAAAASFYRDQIAYAQAAGLDINLVVPGAPDWAQSYTFGKYADACTWFWKNMRETFGDQVALWQPFNEADHAHYQRFTAANRSPAYLGQLAQLLALAKTTLGKDGVPVTTNLTGWPLNDEREQEWYQVLDAIGEPLDVISLDLYPADNEKEIARLTERVERVKRKYGKPVFVAELGLQTTSDSWTEPEQQRYVSAAIAQLRTSELWGICLYELRDTESQPGFGIKRADGTPKQGFADVMRALGP
ncbi:MAG TPA: glycosyl hydrolase [Propionibacteriaceae bacterium]|jgi:hypothetical protein